jgi:prephenate dehydratase
LTTPVGYLGPRGTFSEEALLGAVDAAHVEPVALDTIYDAVMAVRSGRLPWALVPIENSIEGPVTVTLDTLAAEAPAVSVVGEVVLIVRHALVAEGPLALQDIDVVLSHPHVFGQCSRFLRTELPGARIAAANSTAEAVRMVATEGGAHRAAIGTRLAAEIYNGTVIRDGIQDNPDNETRFIWIAPSGADPGRLPLRQPPSPDSSTKTSVVFWGPGAERPGWLVRCLDEFAAREINLTKIESRPRRDRLGQYMFFADIEGRLDEERVAAALAGLRTHSHEVHVLGCYPAVRPGATATLDR